MVVGISLTVGYLNGPRDAPFWVSASITVLGFLGAIGLTVRSGLKECRIVTTVISSVVAGAVVSGLYLLFPNPGQLPAALALIPAAFTLILARVGPPPKIPKKVSTAWVNTSFIVALLTVVAYASVLYRIQPAPTDQQGTQPVDTPLWLVFLLFCSAFAFTFVTDLFRNLAESHQLDKENRLRWLISNPRVGFALANPVAFPPAGDTDGQATTSSP